MLIAVGCLEFVNIFAVGLVTILTLSRGQGEWGRARIQRSVRWMSISMRKASAKCCGGIDPFVSPTSNFKRSWRGSRAPTEIELAVPAVTMNPAMVHAASIDVEEADIELSTYAMSSEISSGAMANGSTTNVVLEGANENGVQREEDQELSDNLFTREK